MRGRGQLFHAMALYQYLQLQLEKTLLVLVLLVESQCQLLTNLQVLQLLTALRTLTPVLPQQLIEMTQMGIHFYLMNMETKMRLPAGTWSWNQLIFLVMVAPLQPALHVAD
jgi:hypothetical protein